MTKAPHPAARTGLARHIIGTVCLILGFGAPAFLSASAEANVGRFQFVFGTVEVTGADGQMRKVRRGSEVLEGDVIRTERRGSAQLRMVDGAALAVRPRSEIRIDTYKFNNDADNDRSFLSLLRGTLRSITGLVGRNNRSGYRVRTPTATIGIRGSDADIGFNPANGLTAVRTYTGGHSLTAPDANGVPTTVDTNPGQIAIAQPGQTPSFANAFPFTTPTPPAGAPQGGQSGDGAADSGDNRNQGQVQQNRRRAANRQLAGPGGAQPQGGPQAGAGGPPPPGSAQANLPLGSFALATPILAPPGTVAAGAVQFSANGSPNATSGVTTAGNNSTIALNGNNQPEAVSGGTIQFVRNGAPLVGPVRSFEVRNANNNVVSRGNWGAYGSGFKVAENGVVRNTSGLFHFATATNQTSVSVVQALGGTGFSSSRYNFAGNTNFSDEAGNFATNSNVVFSGSGSGNLSLGVDADFADGKMFRLSGSDTIENFSNGSGIGLTPFSGDNVGASGAATGRFVGANAQGVVITVGARKSNGKGLVGTAVGISN